uniref:IMD domain-containing protein n=1 Tax=Plectus sambesii TaxID=2011161 RepID=A0A914VPT1_9BILA
MDGLLEKECNALGGLFQSVINEMKNSYPAWEDVAQKAVKLSVQLRSTIVALDQFLDALQKISDYATNTKGRHAFLPPSLPPSVTHSLPH